MSRGSRRRCRSSLKVSDPKISVAFGRGAEGLPLCRPHSMMLLLASCTADEPMAAHPPVNDRVVQRQAVGIGGTPRATRPSHELLPNAFSGFAEAAPVSRGRPTAGGTAYCAQKPNEVNRPVARLRRVGGA